ncbi:MAG TPA: PD-(D/E)XK nuclease family protein [Anaerolineae bacterium]|nr:PD-(D/E)XK nuclease family protein [Anaerolineae bacterium]
MLPPDLLQQAARLNRIHAETAQQERRDFNVFTMLRPEDDEVNLHSRFLFELLNPKGKHGMGTAFLERFLAQVELDTFDVTTATAQREVQNMDIFIANEARQAIILENKIYAPDQPKQLQRYYKAVRKEGYRDVWVLYLTLYGDAPGAESAGDLDEEVITLSYADDVRDWLAACIEIAEPSPVIRETLVQYQWLVEKLTGQAGGRLVMDVKALLKDEESLAAAISIGQALTEVKIDVQFAFWLSLEEKLRAAGFTITDYWKYSRKKVEAYYRKGPRGYGLILALPELLGQDTLGYYVGMDYSRVYYGFITLEDGQPVAKAHDSSFALLVEILKNLSDTWRLGNYMVGFRPSKRRIEFANFDIPDTLALIDPTKRDVYLDELVDEITTAIEQFYDACEHDPRLQDEAAW